MKRVLILSCSKSKRTTSEELPAIRRYTGQLYNTFRKACVAHPEVLSNLEVYILSAEFGIIPAMHRIPYYDRKMDIQRAYELRPDNAIKFTEIVQQLDPTVDEMCLCMSALYLKSFPAGLKGLPDEQMTFCNGDLYHKPAQLREWLLKHIDA